MLFLVLTLAALQSAMRLEPHMLIPPSCKISGYFLIDACVGEALANDYCPRKAILCTKTIYNYIDKGLMRIRNHHLPEKISRKPKRVQVRKIEFVESTQNMI